jgi:hypothetical protein
MRVIVCPAASGPYAANGRQYDAQRLEAEPLVEGRVSGVAGFRVGWHVLLVAPAECRTEQRRSEPLAAEIELNTHRRQGPVRIAWVVGHHLATLSSRMDATHPRPASHLAEAGAQPS